MADLYPSSSHEARTRARRRARTRPMEHPLVVRTTGPAAGVIVVSIVGDIDLANRTELAAGLSPAVTDPDLRLLVCDLTMVGFLACTGVSVLAEARSDLTARGGELRVVATSPSVLRVLAVTDQLDLLGVRPHLDAALTGYLPTRTLT